MADCWDFDINLDVSRWADKWNDCHWWKTDQEIINELKRYFDLDKAKRYLFKLCKYNSSHCGTGDVALIDACAVSGKFERKQCEDLVKPIVESFCKTNPQFAICENRTPAAPPPQPNPPPAEPAPVAPPPLPAVTQAIVEESTKKGGFNMIYLGIGAVVILMILIGVGAFFFICMNSSTPPPTPAPVVNVRTSQTMRSKNHRRKKGKKKRTKKASAMKNPESKKEPVSKKASEVKDPESSKSKTPKSKTPEAPKSAKSEVEGVKVKVVKTPEEIV